MKAVQAYIESNKDRFLDELIDWLKIPSISTDPDYKGEVRNAAEFLVDRLREAKVKHVEIMETPGHPIVFAEHLVDDKLPTVLIYGHYDVQPPDPLHLWSSPPFEPVIKDDKVYARGACDDKGQVYMHVKAIEAMIANDYMPCNVKMIIEGEEESGSEHLNQFLEANKKKLKADVVLVSDTSILANEHPSITTGLRGLAYMEVEVTGPNRDLHSGVYGGAVANPINVLCKMVASLQDEMGRITIPGFYEKVERVSDAERVEMARAPFDLDAYKSDLEVDEVFGEFGYSSNERSSIRPTLDVNGIWGGYTGEGAKTVLPSKAYAKISMRLIKGQQSAAISAMFKAHFEKIAPPYVKIKVTEMHGGEASVTPTDFPAYRAAHEAMKTTFGKDPIPVRSGGSIPVVAAFEEILNLKTVLLGFGLDSDNIHSPDEHYGLFNFYKGIHTLPHFYKNYAALEQA